MDIIFSQYQILIIAATFAGGLNVLLAGIIFLFHKDNKEISK